MATAPLAVIALLSACSDATGDRVSGSATTTAVAPGSTSPPPSSTTTAPSSTVPGAPTTSAPVTAEGRARALYDAWAAGDRAAAERVAQPDAVTTIFSRPWSAGDGWSFLQCSGAAGSVICAWERPTGQQLLMRVQQGAGADPVRVAEVRFQP